MTWQIAVVQARKLHLEWVGSGETDIDHIHRSMLQEYRWVRRNPDRTAVTREIRGQFVLLGKIRKALAK